MIEDCYFWFLLFRESKDSENVCWELVNKMKEKKINKTLSEI